MGFYSTQEAIEASTALVNVVAANAVSAQQMEKALRDVFSYQPMQPNTWPAESQLCCCDDPLMYMSEDKRPSISIYPDEKPKRLRCKYCDCLSEKDYGTCEHCGAPL